MYKTSEILTPKINSIMEFFVENYLSIEFRHEHFESNVINEFRVLFNELAINIINARDNLTASDYKPIVEINLLYRIPYIVVVNELSYIKDTFIHELLKNKAVDEVIFLCKLFDALAKDIAAIYLKNYIKSLHRRNSLRLESMLEINKKIILYYEEHIKWLDKLVDVMEENNTQLMPELDSSLCAFGKWLESEGKYIISNKAKYEEIFSLHKSLHFIASKIKTMLIVSDFDSHTGMTYLEKAEFLSLEIGTELALLDNKLIMLEATKDPLTQVLNRSLLEQFFYDQYKISYITEKPFVLALCDLDHFKTINDTYGHNEGDIILKLFSDTLKKQLRNSDLIFRYGGDEFIIILPASRTTDVIDTFNNIRNRFRNQMERYGKKNRVTISTGLLEITPEKERFTEQGLLEEFIIRVDKNLYKAKANGRDCIM